MVSRDLLSEILIVQGSSKYFSFHVNAYILHLPTAREHLVHITRRQMKAERNRYRQDLALKLGPHLLERCLHSKGHPASTIDCYFGCSRSDYSLTARCCEVQNVCVDSKTIILTLRWMWQFRHDVDFKSLSSACSHVVVNGNDVHYPATRNYRLLSLLPFFYEKYQHLEGALKVNQYIVSDLYTLGE